MTTSPNLTRSHKTVLYITVSIALLFGGAALTFWGSAISSEGIQTSPLLIAIGTSVWAGAIASVALGILRKLDDSDASTSDSKLDELSTKISRSNATILAEVKKESFDLSRLVRVDITPELRCVSDLDIGGEFQRCFARQRQISQPTQPIPIDVVGLKLNRFLDDQYDWLRRTGSRAEIRLLLQNPDKTSFNAICNNENRARMPTINDIAKTLNQFSFGTVEDQSLIAKNDAIVCKIRFYDEYQPVTLFRIGDSCCARPRITTPGGAATRFYEYYDRTDSALHWGVYNRHFEHCWNSSQFVVPKATMPHVNAAVRALST